MKCSARTGKILHGQSIGRQCKDEAFAKCSECDQGFCENHNVLDECERKGCHNFVCHHCRSFSKEFNNLLCQNCRIIAEQIVEKWSIDQDNWDWWEALDSDEFYFWMRGI